MPLYERSEDLKKAMAENFCKSLKIEEAKVDSFYLPDEILIEIVLRLPVKSILTWSSVSKSWNSLIKNPNFISTHLNHNNHNKKRQLLFLRKLSKFPLDRRAKKGEKEVFSLNWDNEAFDEYTRFDSPLRALRLERVPHIVGTCNGLVCLSDAHSYVVWNPCIKKYVTVPTRFSAYRPYAGSGFGFDSKNNDYKVVRIVDQHKFREVKFKDSKTNEYKVLRILKKKNKGEVKVLEVYSLATMEWKMVSETAVPRYCSLIEREPRQAFVNGALHWVVASHKVNYGYCNFILAFDLGDEKVREIMLPKDLLFHDIFDDSSHLSVSVFGESLAVYRRLDTDNCTDIWVMKEYGVEVSWTKVFTVDSQGDERKAPNAVGFRNNGEVVMEVEHGKLVSLDPEHKKIKDLGLRVPYGFTFVDPYVESLVLLTTPTFSFLERKKQQVEEQNHASSEKEVLSSLSIEHNQLSLT